MKIQTNEGNEEGKKHYFKKIMMSDKALGTSLYSPKYSSNHQYTEMESNNISDDDITEREHSIVRMRPKEKENYLKRMSSR